MQAPPTACIARGPDGTTGFALQRIKGESERTLEPQVIPDRRTHAVASRSDLTIGMSLLLLAAMLAALLPGLAATIAALFVLDSIGQRKRELAYAIAVSLEVVGGLVLVLGVADCGIKVLATASRFVFLGGVPSSGFLALALLAGQWALRGAKNESTTTLGVEEGAREEEEEATDVPCGNQACLEVNPLGDDVALLPSTAAAAEAGRLHRRAAAALQNKIFDPGGR